MFKPQDHVKKVQGMDYLEVKWRLVWFRDDHPKGSIITEIINDGVIKATIIDGDGKLLATGHGTPKLQGVAKARPFEGAETAAIGRALAHAGYGTQFTDELDEGDHLADSPIEPTTKKEVKATNSTIWTVAQKQVLIDEHLANNDFGAKGMLGLSNLKPDASEAEILAWGRVYRAHRNELDEKTGKSKHTAQESADFANNGGK